MYPCNIHSELILFDNIMFQFTDIAKPTMAYIQVMLVWFKWDEGLASQPTNFYLYN